MKSFFKTSFFCLLCTKFFAQNVGINTTGATPAATNMFEVLQTSTSVNTVGIYTSHSGAIAGTGYGIWAEKTGASTTNVASYFSASGATNNYAIIVPASGGNVGIGTSAPESLLEVQGVEANDATITLDADDGDDNADTWFIKSLASDNNLSFSNHTTEYFKMNGPRLYVMNSGNSVFVGEDAGKNDDLSANLNTGVGFEALKANTTGFQNVALGYQALKAETTGNSTVAIGTYTLLNQNGGGNNTAVGHDAMNACTSGGNNTAIGIWALRSNSTQWNNVAIGGSSLYNTTGGNNIGIGYQAGDNLTSGTNNIIIGYDVDVPVATSSNQLNIGNLIFSAGISGTGTTLSTGSIGIGSTSPEAKLEVQGLEGLDAGIALDADDGDDNADTWFIKSQAADNDLTITNHATELMRVTDGGSVGIGTSGAPSSKAIMEMTSTTTGVLIPRMTNAQRTAIAPGASANQGLLIYQTDVGTTAPTGIGFYYWDGSAWTGIGSNNSGASSSSLNFASNIQIQDEFMGDYKTLSAGGNFYDCYSKYSLGWERTPTAPAIGTGAMANWAGNGTSTISHPGVTKIIIGNSSPSQNVALYTTGSPVDARSTNFIGSWIISNTSSSLSGASGAANEYNIKVGLMTQADWTSTSTGNPTDGIFFETTANNALWYGTTVRSAATAGNTKTSTTIAPALNTWIRLDLRSDAAGTTWYFYVNGTLRVTTSTNIPASGTMLVPGFKIVTGTSGSHTIFPEISIDYFYMNSALSR